MATVYRRPFHDDVTKAITEHLAMLLEENTSIDTEAQPHGTMECDIRRTDLEHRAHGGAVVIEVQGRSFTVELHENLI